MGYLINNNKKTGYVYYERIIGELLVVLGVFIVFVYECYTFVLYLKSDSFHLEPSFVSVLLIAVGFLILFVSVYREQLFSAEKQRYKDVEK